MKPRFHISRFILLIVLTIPLFKAHGQPIQRYNSFKYTVNDGLLQSTMSDINFDDNNFCWLAFPNGIQKFDGKRFIDIPVQDGLPDNKWVYFFRCKNGDLLVSHSMGISKYNIRNNKFSLVYRQPASGGRPMQFLGEDNMIVYCFNNKGNVVEFSGPDYSTISDFASGIPGYAMNPQNLPTISQNIIDNVVVLQSGSSLYSLNLRQRRLIREPVSIPGIYNFFLWQESANQVLYYRFNDQYDLLAERYNFISGIKKLLIDKPPSIAAPRRCRIYKWNGKTIISFNNHLYETSPAFDSIKFELADYENRPISGNSAIAKILEDNHGNLYLQTVNDGFRKIIRNSYPIKYYGAEKKEDRYTISVLPDKKNNRILAGTYGSGLVIFDTLQRLIKHIKTLPGEKQGFAVNCIVKKPDGSYLLSVLGDRMWLLTKDLLSLKPLSINTTSPGRKAEISYFANTIYVGDQSAIIKSQQNFYRIQFKTNSIQEYHVASVTDTLGYCWF